MYNRLRRLRRRTRHIVAGIYPRRIKRGPKTFTLPALGRNQPIPAESEPWLEAWLARAMDLSPGSFVDVGVNLGQTLLKVRTIDADLPYVGFEPNPGCTFFVQRLSEMNGLNAIIAPVGLSDRPGLLRLSVKGDFSSDASLVSGFRPEAFYRPLRREVAVLVGDEVLPELAPPPGIIKIDVEGGELEVLRGLVGTLKAARPILFCESLPTGEPGSETYAFRKQRKDALSQLLRELDYEIYRLVGQHDRLLKCPDLPHDTRLEQSDYLLLPRERGFSGQLSDLGLIDEQVRPDPGTSRPVS